MPAEHLTPGFFGKIPATGDFVTRRLPGDFVRFWDRFAARHLAAWQRDDLWPANLGLRFLLRLERSGPVAGVAIPSFDRVGRRFPLVAAAPSPHAGLETVAVAGTWFDRIQDILVAGRDRETGADALAEDLAGQPFPRLSPSTSRPLRHMLLWTDGMSPIEAGPEAPREALEVLFATVHEAG